MIHRVYVVVYPTDVGDFEVACKAKHHAIRQAFHVLSEMGLDPCVFKYSANFVGFWGTHPDSPVAQFEVLAEAMC